MTASDAPDSALGALLSVPPPVLAPEVLRHHLQQGWGLAGQLSPLTSERDLNHRLTTEQGTYLVKLTNPAEPEAMTDFQTRAFLHVAATDPGVPVARLIPPSGGGLWRVLPEGRLRVFSWLEGTPVHALPRSDTLSANAGAALARLTWALADFSHPASDHVLLWDIKQAPRLAPLLPALTDPALRAEAQAFVADFTARISPQLRHMPTQVCHSDLNPHNVLASAADPAQISGILDFGDMVLTPRICDLAVALAYQVDPARPQDSLCAFLSGYARHQTVTAAEVALLFDLITARMFTTLAIAGWRAARQPENAAYILRNAPSARAGLAAFRALGAGPATEAFARALHLI